MSRKIISGFVVFTLLTASAIGSADAQRFKGQSGANSNNGGGANSATVKRHKPPNPNSLSGGQQQSSTSTAASIHALTVYLQWRKCLDNMLPKCP